MESNFVLLSASDRLFASSIPEPVTAAIVISGIAGIAFVRRRNERDWAVGDYRD